ncbi:Uma2 family endonuclease [Gloeomargarita lithophora]|nr:Uma2 family endonuclease [Gloeomargarita lithophora]
MVFAPAITWEPLPADYLLPDDPVDNIQQPLLAHALNDALDGAGWVKPEMLIAINMGLVAKVAGKFVVKAPDWFYVSQVQPLPAGVIRRSYTPHCEGGSVAVVMEFLSDTDGNELAYRDTFPYGKLYFYEQILQVPVYVMYDPYRCHLTVRYWQNGRYILGTPDAQGRFWLAEMNLFLGLWSGERQGFDIPWLRWWDRSGNLLLWPLEQVRLAEQRVESAQRQATQEHQRAERLAARLRELGLNPDEL